MFKIGLPMLLFALMFNVAFADITMGDATTALGTAGPATIINNVLSWLAGILALISVLIIVIAGIMWVTAGGNEETVKKARTMIMYAIIGLVIAGAAYGLVSVVVDNFFS